MSTTYASTPVQELSLDVPESNRSRGQVRISDWGDHHDVYPWLLPLTNREQKPLDTARVLHDGLNDLHELAETFRRKDFGLENQGDNVTQHVMRLFGVTIFNDTKRPVRYRNPNYLHYEERTVPVDSIEERHEHYQKWRHIPTVNAEFFDHHWGLERGSSTDWIRNNYGSYEEQRHQNRVRLAKTLRTHNAWTGESIRSICSVLPINYNTAKHSVRRYAKDADWKPPERPCSKHWFMASH